MTVPLYVVSPFSDCPPLCFGRTAPEVSEEEGSYTLRFYRWFLEKSKNCLLLLVALLGLTDTLAQLLAWRSLLWLSMTWRRRYLTRSNFLSTTSLAWSLALHLLFCFSQGKSLRWKETHTHTHTHTRTHTHTMTWWRYNIRVVSKMTLKEMSEKVVMLMEEKKISWTSYFESELRIGAVTMYDLKLVQ